LYDLRVDPHERENVFALHPDTARALELRLREWRNGLQQLPTLSGASDVEIPDELAERLRGLGYLD
jgi:hypothetical protein